MARRILPKSNIALLVLVSGVAAFAAPAVAAGSDAGPVPSNVATLGDSIARGFNACGFFVDCTSKSWATGDNPQVNSHYLRIKALNAAASGHNSNDAKAGASASDMVGQARTAVSQRADYVTMLIGANDACRGSVSKMTPVRTFRARIDAALDTLNRGRPAARIFVASIPDIRRLWQLEKDSLAARTVWAVGGVCQSMLASPRSTKAADVQRRQRVYQRIVDFNTELARSCAAHQHCRFDHNAVFSTAFNSSQVSGWDHFHPNAAGQALLARVTYAAGFNW